jgi:predicted permease
MKGLFTDFRHAIRLYARTPGASLIAVLALAVAIAFVGAFLALYVDLVLRPHPGIEQSNRLVSIVQNDGARSSGLPIALIDRMADEMTSLEAVAGVEATGVQFGPDQDFVTIEVVTRDFFAGIRPRLQLGRGLEPSDHEPDAEPAIVISATFWEQQFDSSKDVLGTLIAMGMSRLDQEGDESESSIPEYRIVGVMSADMTGLMADEVGAWMPLEHFLPVLMRGADLERALRSVTMRSLGRRAGGVPVNAVGAEINARYPESTEGFDLRPGWRLDAVAGAVRNVNVHRDAKRQLQMFLIGSVLLALVAAANVSLFLLSRAPGRRRELAIRMSVGAPLRRLARQLASEAGLLVLVAAALGLLLSVWVSSFLRGLAFLREANWDDVSLLDWRVLTIVGIFLLLLALLVSLAPIVGLRRLGIAASSRQVAARATLAQRIAGTAQIAIAGALGAAAIAFGWHLGSMMLGDHGYQTANLYSVTLSPNFRQQEGGGPIIFGTIGQIDSIRQREVIESLPGVTEAAFGSPIPGDNRRSTRTIEHPMQPNEQVEIRTGALDGHFLDLLGLRLLHGSGPGDGDIGVGLVNQTLAQEIWGRDNVVGESLAISSQGQQRTEIIGVLEDLSFDHPAAEAEPMLFLVGGQSPFQMTALIETTMTAADLQQALQGLVDSGAIESGITTVTSLAELRSNLIAPDTARSWLTIGTASLVVLLAAFGFYGTQRYLVTAGRREYAIRASLGAGPAALSRLVLSRGVLMSVPGLVLGALLALAIAAWLRDDFVSRDISALAVTLAVLLGLGLLLLAASLGPARLARRTQPAPLLRED